MRKFYVTFYNVYGDVVNSVINLDSGENANDIAFQAKINEIYINTNRTTDFCAQVLSWSLIEE